MLHSHCHWTHLLRRQLDRRQPPLRVPEEHCDASDQTGCTPVAQPVSSRLAKSKSPALVHLRDGCHWVNGGKKDPEKHVDRTLIERDKIFLFKD